MYYLFQVVYLLYYLLSIVVIICINCFLLFLLFSVFNYLLLIFGIIWINCFLLFLLFFFFNFLLLIFGIICINCVFCFHPLMISSIYVLSKNHVDMLSSHSNHHSRPVRLHTCVIDKDLRVVVSIYDVILHPQLRVQIQWICIKLTECRILCFQINTSENANSKK